ncbi:MAG: DUF167 domain-containing protein [Candidatus Zapsychrus exili]|nr:DUF167 domain-containing protein [Candidatus Zapsychrus exili]
MKTIEIRVVPGSSREFVKEEQNNLKVYLRAPAVDGKANKALLLFLAKYFNVKKNKVDIIKGLKSRNKTVNINI